MTQNINKRIAELSATLSPIDKTIDNAICPTQEMWGIAEEFISYNTPYYHNGFQQVDFDGAFRCCLCQAVGEFQVLRFYYLQSYMDGYPLLQFFLNEDKDDSYNEDFEPSDLEILNYVEYKQVWIDSNKHFQTITLAECHVDDTESELVLIHSMHDWASENWCARYIINEVNEREDFCHGYAEPILRWRLSNVREFINTYHPHIADIINYDYEYKSFAMKFFHIFKIARKHNFRIPNDRNEWRLYMDYIEMMDKYHLDTHNPLLICPTDIHAAHQRLLAQLPVLDARLQAEHRERERQRAMALEQEFAKEHSYLFDIHFDNGHFQFDSLDSIEAYRKEGEIMHHCVYNMGYYKKHHVLTMHVSDLEGNRVATCSVNVVTSEIIELQTMCNDKEWREGNEYKEIFNTLMARMHTFPRPQNHTTKHNKQKVA